MTDNERKECVDCNNELPLDQFYYVEAKKKHMNRCKACYAIHRKQASENYRIRHPEKIKANNKSQSLRRQDEKRAYAKEYHKKNRDRALEQRKEWYQRQDREDQLKKRREWYANNRERHSKNREIYYNGNKERLRKARRKWENERLNNDLDYKLRKALAGRVRSVVKGISKKDKSIVELIGCSIEYFREYIKSQFADGMSWDNWAQYGWHIDHKIPLSWFNLENENCRKKAFHYTNMQPLWWQDNLAKKNFYSHKLEDCNV